MLGKICPYEKRSGSWFAFHIHSWKVYFTLDSTVLSKGGWEGTYEFSYISFCWAAELLTPCWYGPFGLSEPSPYHWIKVTVKEVNSASCQFSNWRTIHWQAPSHACTCVRARTHAHTPPSLWLALAFSRQTHTWENKLISTGLQWLKNRFRIVYYGRGCVRQNKSRWLVTKVSATHHT